MIRICLVLAAFATVPALASSAQGWQDAAKQVADCRSIADEAERLTCFDRASGPLADLVTQTPPAPETAALPNWADEPAPDPAPALASTEEKSVPIWARVLPKRDSADTPDEIKVTVVRIMRNNVGRHFFVTDDGQEWEQIVAETVRAPGALPAGATIAESLFGSPRLTFDDGPSGAYGVKRVE